MFFLIFPMLQMRYARNRKIVEKLSKYCQKSKLLIGYRRYFKNINKKHMIPIVIIKTVIID